MAGAVHGKIGVVGRNTCFEDDGLFSGTGASASGSVLTGTLSPFACAIQAAAVSSFLLL